MSILPQKAGVKLEQKVNINKEYRVKVFKKEQQISGTIKLEEKLSVNVGNMQRH
jgi:hypothetical protein